jgi:hypothetical protein
VKERDEQFRKWLPLLDVLILLLFPVTLLALGFDHSPRFYGVFDYLTSERVLTVLTIVSLIRLCVAYPLFLNPGRANLVETIRSQSHSDAYWLGFSFDDHWLLLLVRLELLLLSHLLRADTDLQKYARCISWRNASLPGVSITVGTWRKAGSQEDPIQVSKYQGEISIRRCLRPAFVGVQCCSLSVC